MLIVIVGESASGKTTFAKALEIEQGYKRVVTYTTRPPREGEKNGIDYFFVTEEEFLTHEDNKTFFETAEYNDWNYGSSIMGLDIENSNYVIILTPTGMRSLLQYVQKYGLSRYIFTCYIKNNRRSRLIKILQRGDNIEEAYRRNLADVGQFDGVENEVNFVLENDGYIKPVNELEKELISKINEFNNNIETEFKLEVRDFIVNALVKKYGNDYNIGLNNGVFTLEDEKTRYALARVMAW